LWWIKPFHLRINIYDLQLIQDAGYMLQSGSIAGIWY
jgi:hypothetical protein